MTTAPRGPLIRGRYVLLRLLSVEMTSGATLGVAVVMLGFAVVGGLNVGIGLPAPGWTSPVNTALTGTLYLAPLAAGTCSWVVQQVQRSRLDLLAETTSRGAVPAVVLRASAVLIWAVLAWIILLTVIALRSRVVGLPDGATLLLAVLALTVLAAAASLGTGLGRMTSSRLAAPALATLIFGWLFIGSYLPGWPGRLAPIFSGGFNATYLQPRVALLLVQLVGLVGLIGLATVPLLHRLRARMVTTLAAAATVTAAVLALAVLGPAATEVRAAPAKPVCFAGDGIEVCLRPVNEPALAASHRALSRTVSAIRPVLDTPTRFSEPGMASDALAGSGVFIPPLTDAPQLFSQAAARAVLPVAPCPRADAAQALQAYSELTVWVQARAFPTLVPPYDQARLGDVLSLDLSGQRAWADQRFDQVRACAS